MLGYGSYYSIFFDEIIGKYAMYLAIYPPEADPGTFVVRLLSDDPTDWQNPVYDVAMTPAWRGFDHVVTKKDGNRFCPLVTRPLAGTPLAEKGYIAATLIPSDHSDQYNYMAYSQDGLNFTVDWARPWYRARSDTWSGIVWNEQSSFFQIFTQPVNVDRRIFFMTRPDFSMFSPLTTVVQPDALDRLGTEFYSMHVRRYEDLYIGPLHIFQTDTFEEERIKMAGRMETELTYSYNGFNWDPNPARVFCWHPQLRVAKGWAMFGVGDVAYAG